MIILQNIILIYKKKILKLIFEGLNKKKKIISNKERQR